MAATTCLESSPAPCSPHAGVFVPPYTVQNEDIGGNVTLCLSYCQKTYEACAHAQVIPGNVPVTTKYASARQFCDSILPSLPVVDGIANQDCFGAGSLNSPGLAMLSTLSLLLISILL
mmetsp:Transcript_71800/g.169028  ORF Transcript_71800/g.169028 Transcript_71800/m.169028 type:complete len:118 (+) Transcript_71800:713-1066(+)